jgi:hypothetical protein
MIVRKLADIGYVNSVKQEDYLQFTTPNRWVDGDASHHMVEIRLKDDEVIHSVYDTGCGLLEDPDGRASIEETYNELVKEPFDLVEDMRADFIERYGDYGIYVKSIRCKYDNEVYYVMGKVHCDEMVCWIFDHTGTLRSMECEPGDAWQCLHWWAEREVTRVDVCLCAECREMLYAGDDKVQNPVYKDKGYGMELQYIELAHRNCLPEWSKYDNVKF